MLGVHHPLATDLLSLVIVTRYQLLSENLNGKFWKQTIHKCKNNCNKITSLSQYFPFNCDVHVGLRYIYIYFIILGKNALNSTC